MGNEAQQEGKEWPAGNLGMHDEDGVDRNHQPDEQSIKEGLVVGHNQRAFIVEDARIPSHLDPEQSLQERSNYDFEHDDSPASINRPGLNLRCHGTDGDETPCWVRHRATDAQAA